MSRFAGRYYVESLAGYADGDTLELSGSESAHLVKVRRARVETSLEVFDGLGHLAPAVIESVDRHHALLRLGPVHRQAPPAKRIHVVTAVPKGERLDTMLDMLTQVGVDRISLVHFSHSVRRPDPGKDQRRKATLINACKQSRRLFLPTLSGPETLDTWLATNSSRDVVKLVADPRGVAIASMQPVTSEIEEILIVIGPEAGLEADETAALYEAGYKPVCLGEAILRIETAAVAFAAVLQSRLHTD